MSAQLRSGGAFVIINALYVAIWAMGPRTNFWPVWILIFWGVAVAFHGWWANFGNSITERDVRREMSDSR